MCWPFPMPAEPWAVAACKGWDRYVEILVTAARGCPLLPWDLWRHERSFSASHHQIPPHHPDTSAAAPHPLPTRRLPPLVAALYDSVALLQLVHGDPGSGDCGGGAATESIHLFLPQLLQMAECQLAWVEGPQGSSGGSSTQLCPDRASVPGDPLCSPTAATATLSAACGYIICLIQPCPKPALGVSGLSAVYLKLLAMVVRLHNAVVRRAGGVGCVQEREEWCAAMMRYSIPHQWSTVSEHHGTHTSTLDVLQHALHALCVAEHFPITFSMRQGNSCIILCRCHTHQQLCLAYCVLCICMLVSQCHECHLCLRRCLCQCFV